VMKVRSLRAKQLILMVAGRSRPLASAQFPV
jgi:hypothetical protein